MASVTVTTPIGGGLFVGTGETGPIAAADLTNGATGGGAVMLAEFPALPPVLFADLPTLPAAGMLAYVTNSNTAAWGATVAAGGANHVIAWYRGGAWRVFAA